MVEIGMENDTAAKTVTFFVEGRTAELTFTADEFRAAPSAKAFLEAKATECAALVGAAEFTYIGSLKSIMERAK